MFLARIYSPLSHILFANNLKQAYLSQHYCCEKVHIRIEPIFPSQEEGVLTHWTNALEMIYPCHIASELRYIFYFYLSSTSWASLVMSCWLSLKS